MMEGGIASTYTHTPVPVMSYNPLATIDGKLPLSILNNCLAWAPKAYEIGWVCMAMVQY